MRTLAVDVAIGVAGCPAASSRRCWAMRACASSCSIVRRPARTRCAAEPEDGGRIRGTRGTPNWVRRAGGPGWALLGDAGMHLDPWTGRGMDFAATHARFLARAILAAAAGADPATELARYQAERDAHALDTYRFTVDGARDLTPFGRHETWGIPRLPAPPPGRYRATA